tara:strand:- start:337 stop:576 length:240 start_codon:yes stop_codon:yes gene_type:complete
MTDVETVVLPHQDKRLSEHGMSSQLNKKWNQLDYSIREAILKCSLFSGEPLPFEAFISPESFSLNKLQPFRRVFTVAAS